jgi:hypothetical protein
MWTTSNEQKEAPFKLTPGPHTECVQQTTVVERLIRVRRTLEPSSFGHVALSTSTSAPNHSSNAAGAENPRISELLSDDGLHGHYEFRALLSTGSGALTMRVRFR